MPLHWHRRDPRPADDVGLAAAAAATAPDASDDAGDADLLALFVLDGALLAHAGSPRIAFLLDALDGLRSWYRGRGGEVLLDRGDPREAVPEVADPGVADPTSGRSNVFSYWKTGRVLTPVRSEVTSEDAHMTSTNDERADGTDAAGPAADAGTGDAGTDEDVETDGDAKPFGTRLWQLVVSITVLTGVSVVVGYGGGLLLWISACLGGPDPRTDDGELLRDRLLDWPERNREFMRRNGHGELPLRP